MLRFSTLINAIPFSCSKWEFLPQPIQGLNNRSGKTQHGVYFLTIGAVGFSIGTSFPCMTYSPNESRAFTIYDAARILLDLGHAIRLDPLDDPEAGCQDIEPLLCSVKDTFIARCDAHNLKVTSYARKFLELYYQMIHDMAYPSNGSYPDIFESNGPCENVCSALFPMLEAWLATDIVTGSGAMPDPRVDFAFWTGRSVYAIEIVGGSHVGKIADVRRDRLLKSKGIETLYFQNDEISNMTSADLSRELPVEVVYPVSRPRRRC